MGVESVYREGLAERRRRRQTERIELGDLTPEEAFLENWSIERTALRRTEHFPYVRENGRPLVPTWLWPNLERTLREHGWHQV